MEVAQCLPHNYSVVRKLEAENKELRSRLALDELLDEREEMEGIPKHLRNRRVALGSTTGGLLEKGDE